MKHTKGEWEITGYAGEHDEAGASIKCNGEFICCTSHLKDNNWSEYEANAQLIASAPDLLEAAENAKIRLNELMGHPDWKHSGLGSVFTEFKNLSKAIKKATS